MASTHILYEQSQKENTNTTTNNRTNKQHPSYIQTRGFSKIPTPVFVLPNKDNLNQRYQQQPSCNLPRIDKTQWTKYLPDSPATSKGHMHQTRKNIRSTTKGQQSNTLDMQPKHEPEATCDMYYLPHWPIKISIPYTKTWQENFQHNHSMAKCTFSVPTFIMQML